MPRRFDSRGLPPEHWRVVTGHCCRTPGLLFAPLQQHKVVVTFRTGYNYRLNKGISRKLSSNKIWVIIYMITHKSDSTFSCGKTFAANKHYSLFSRGFLISLNQKCSFMMCLSCAVRLFWSIYSVITPSMTQSIKSPLAVLQGQHHYKRVRWCRLKWPSEEEFSMKEPTYNTCTV